MNLISLYTYRYNRGFKIVFIQKFNDFLFNNQKFNSVGEGNSMLCRQEYILMLKSGFRINEIHSDRNACLKEGI